MFIEPTKGISRGTSSNYTPGSYDLERMYCLIIAERDFGFSIRPSQSNWRLDANFTE